MPLRQHCGMKTIAVISQKGGSGKTTLSLNLAIAATASGQSALIIDLDPQQSAARWSRLRGAPEPVIISAHAPNLDDLIGKARVAGADLVIIDTAPKSEGATLAAAKCADLLLIPCQPSSLDLDAVADTVNIARLAARPALFVLNGCKAGSALVEQAADALTDYKLPIAPVRIGHRVAFVKSLTHGLGVIEAERNGPAAKEINQLYKYICSKGDM